MCLTSITYLSLRHGIGGCKASRRCGATVATGSSSSSSDPAVLSWAMGDVLRARRGQQNTYSMSIYLYLYYNIQIKINLAHVPDVMLSNLDCVLFRCISRTNVSIHAWVHECMHEQKIYITYII